MGKLLTLLLGLLVVMFLGYKVMYRPSLTGGGDPQTPPERLQEAKAAAKRIEVEQQQHADEALAKPAQGGE